MKIKVVTPTTYGKDIKDALKELDYFFTELGVKTSDDAEWVLSLGNTDLAKKSNTLDLVNGLYDDGFIIKTIDKTYFIVAPDERGVLFGVYEWLHELAGLEVYSSEQYELGSFVFAPVNKKVNPSLAYRARGWYPWNKYNPEIKNRLRYTEPNWITFSHTMLTILPKSKYYESHPEYYATPLAQQLCFTNEEMTEAFIKESIERYITPENMKGKRTAIFFVGQEDNGFFCQCEKCKASYEKIGLSGTMIVFVKKVAKAINEYVEKNMPNNIIKTVTFAYASTNQLPVDDNFKPLDESVMFEKNMGIMLTLGAHNIKEKDLTTRKKYLKDVLTLGGESYIWTYDSIFDDELIFLDTLDYGKFYNELFIKNGAMLHYDQGHYSANIAFDELSNYVRAKMMWDITLDQNALAKDFIRAFYKEGAKEVETYYNELCELEKSWDFREDVLLFVRRTPELKNPNSFPKDKLLRWIDLLTKGIVNAKEEKVKLRIVRERLTPIYLLVEIYGEELEKEYLKNLIDTFYQDALNNNVSYYAEHGPENYNKDMHAKITQWRSLII